MKLNLIMAAVLVLSATMANAKLQEMTDAEMSESSICGISQAYFTIQGINKKMNENEACTFASLLDATTSINIAQESLAVIDARNATNNEAIQRSVLKNQLANAIAKQDQAVLALQQSLLSKDYNGNRRTVALDFIGQLQSISFGQIDGSTRTYRRIIDDGCTGTSICFHTEVQQIDTSKINQRILRLQIK